MTRKLLLTIAFAIASVQIANAADLPVKAPWTPVTSMTGLNWTGCYVGGFIGGAGGSNVDAGEPTSVVFGNFYNLTGTPYSYRTGLSVIGGGTLGCNWQASGSPWVLGIEGELGYLHSAGTAIDPNSAPAANDTSSRTVIGDWYAVVAGRAGYAFDRVLLYGKLGAAFTRSQSSTSDTCNTAPCGLGLISTDGSKTVTGLAAGGGIEYALYDHWTIKAEYLWLGVRASYTACGPNAGGGIECGSYSTGGLHTGKVGLNYKF